jgi:hypothetical protein
MKLFGVIGTAVLSLTLGATALAYPQQEQHEQEEQKDKPAQEKEKKAQPDKPSKQEEKNAHQQDKNAKPEEKEAQQQDRNTNTEEHNAKQQQHTQQAQPDRQTEHAAAGRIPDERFKANFGREHRFRVTQADYSGRRFQYGGYWFGFVDPWPSNWLYTQDVFVVEINGVYYLCNPNYPGVNIALNVTL